MLSSCSARQIFVSKSKEKKTYQFSRDGCTTLRYVWDWHARLLSLLALLLPSLPLLLFAVAVVIGRCCCWPGCCCLEIICAVIRNKLVVIKKKDYVAASLLAPLLVAVRVLWSLFWVGLRACVAVAVGVRYGGVTRMFVSRLVYLCWLSAINFLFWMASRGLAVATTVRSG
jgi:hypothetical protein